MNHPIQALLAELPESQRKVILALVDDPGSTAFDLGVQLKRPEREVKSDLEALRERKMCRRELHDRGEYLWYPD